MSRETLRDAPTLDYRPPPSRRRDSAWSVVGFALALVAAIFAGLMWWEMWQGVRSGARGVWFGVSPLYYLGAAAAAALCARGLTRGRKRFALAGLLLAVLSVASAAFLAHGSPW